MKRSALLCIMILLTVSFQLSGIPNNNDKKAKEKGAFYTGKYRNLFLENGNSLKEIQARNEEAYRFLFHGDSATQAVVFKAGSNENGPMEYVCDILHNDVRSEGISYGMMIAVQMNKKDDFDAIWNWAMTHMYVNRTGHPSEGYFAWSLKRDGTPNSETAAPDGEEYIVTALYFASGRWGNGEGIYNYRAWADKILTAMRHRTVKRGMTKFGPRTVGNMVDEKAMMIRFVPDSGRWGHTDPSYHLPAFYEVWAKWGPEPDRSFWADVADTSRSFFHKATHPITGLAPDYANFDGTPVVTRFNQRSGNFSFDARRTQMNWSVDWSWWRKDPGQQELSNRLQAFFASHGMDTYGTEYTLDGTILNKGHAKGLVATNAVMSLAATHPLAGDFVEALWNTQVPLAFNERYYDGLLYMMAMLHCSGEFRIWKPK